MTATPAMKKIFLSLLVICQFALHAFSQTSPAKKKQAGNKGLCISTGINVPVGDFSSTHLIGVSLAAGPAIHQYNLNKDHTIGFVYQGGIAYYLGKKETIAGYVYKYPGYIFLHAFGGVSFLVQKNSEIVISAGPALGFYNGNIKFNAGASLTANFSISNNFALGPSIMMMKEFGTNALWAPSLRATFYFIKNLNRGTRF